MKDIGVEILADAVNRGDEVLTEGALAFVALLQREFRPRVGELLRARANRQERIQAGERPSFLGRTKGVREAHWTIGPQPPDLNDRRTEITGPTERKMLINALNSGARVFMADFEDSNTPTWNNMVAGQLNLVDAIERTIAVQSGAETYRLHDETATLMVRPRGWHLPESHVHVDGKAVSGALFDFGIYFFHNAARLIERGSGPYFYLPKLENHLEARLWNDVFCFAQDTLGINRGTIRATVLIETILAAFEMDEILYELRDHSAGLNAGRWDYIFSLIKKFRDDPNFLMPDRHLVTMTVPFMRAYAKLLVHTCHKRRAHAIGGMAAFIPSRKNPENNERAFARVRDDKAREAADGFDGTWVAHPDLVSTAMDEFSQVLGANPNQIDSERAENSVEADDLLSVRVPGGSITEEGLRNNVSVTLQYIESWLRGYGAVSIFNMMEDVATAEIARSQVWQWMHHEAALDSGQAVTAQLVKQVTAEELARLRDNHGDEAFSAGRFDEARRLFEKVALSSQFVEFLTLPAYDVLRSSRTSVASQPLRSD